MDFIDNVHFVLEKRRRKRHGLAQFPDIVHAGIGRGVNFNYVQGLVAVYMFASDAFFTTDGIVRFFAIYGLGQNAGNGSFSRAARSGEKISLSEAVVLDGIRQSPDDMRLPDDFIKIFRAIFSVESG